VLPAGATRIDAAHPGGFFTVEIAAEGSGANLVVRRAALLRTARKLMTGEVFVPRSAWAGPAG